MKQTLPLATSLKSNLQRLFLPWQIKKLGLFIEQWGGRIIFVLGLITYLAIQGALVMFIIANKSAPVEADDAYTYVVKATQLQTCFWQDCPALNDLRSQLEPPTSNTTISWLRHREYNRSFRMYALFHSGLLSAFHTVGLSWEMAFNLLGLSGVIFIGLAAGFWLYSLYGPGPAGIALAFLAFNIFPGQGLDRIVPSNLALGIAFLTWGYLKQQGFGQWSILVGILGMIAMHPMGRIYAAIAIVAYLLTNYPLTKQRVLIVGIGFLLVAFSFILPMIVSRPELAIESAPYPGDKTVWTVWLEHSQKAGKIVRNWINDHGGYLSVGLLVSIGFLSMPAERRRQTLIMGGLLGLFLGVALFYVLPQHPAEVFARVWIPCALLLTGLVGQTAWAWLTTISRRLQRGIFKLDIKTSSRMWLLSRQGWMLILLTLLGLILLRSSGHNFLSGIDELKARIEKSIQRQPIRLDAVQPALIFDETGECGTILYYNEIVMHFFFSRGTLSCGAVYYPTVNGTDEQKIWLDDNQDITHAVAWNPVQSLTGAQDGSLLLNKGDKLEIRTSKAISLNQLHFYFVNPETKAAITVEVLNRNSLIGKAVELQLQARWSGWLQVDDQREVIGDTFRVKISKSAAPLRLEGLRTTQNTTLRWPWNQVSSLILIPAGEANEPQEISFKPAVLYPGLDHPVKILADDGSSVLAVVRY